jgi:acyl carrier protein
MPIREKQTMTVNASELGIGQVVEELRQLLVDKFRVARSADQIDVNEPLFEAGVGLSSLEGLELLDEIEKRYGVQFHDVERWVDESPTLLVMAERLIEETQQQLVLQ